MASVPYSTSYPKQEHHYLILSSLGNPSAKTIIHQVHLLF
ncbi:hypothetical protein LINPERPRIM_LOCUS43207 [Linum perenne]